MRKQNGSGCACGGMEMLGFPKSGGQMNANALQPVVMKNSSMNMKTPIMKNSSMNVATPMMKKSRNISTPTMSYSSVNSNTQSNFHPKQHKAQMKKLHSNIQTTKASLNALPQANSGVFSNSSPGLFGGARGGYRATRKNKKYLKLFKQGKSIGFTMRSSLKAKGLIPRSNGTYKVSKKYL